MADARHPYRSRRLHHDPPDVTDADPLEELTGVEDDFTVVVEVLVPELVEPPVAAVVELVDVFVPEAVEAVVPVAAEAVPAVVALAPELDSAALEVTDSAVRCVCPENEAAATAEKTPVRPAAPVRPNRVRRRIRLTPSSRAPVLLGDIRFPF
jgi:hypothetical protein